MENPRSLTNRIDVVEQQLLQVRHEMFGEKSRDGNASPRLQVRMAKTTSTSGGGSYPSEPADTYGIIFVDGTYTQTAGLQGHTLTNRKSAPAVEVAHSVDTKYYPVDTYVWVVRQNHKWWIIDVAGRQLTFFELTANLVYNTPPASDNAVILEWTGSAYAATGPAIRVFDWLIAGTYGQWVGRAPAGADAGYQGIAVIGTSGRYEIVWMEEQAKWIKFTINSQLKYNASSVAATLVTKWDGREVPTGTLTVYNSETDASGVYEFWGPTDAVGYAVWDEVDSKYKIIALETHAKKIEFTLASSSAGTAAFSAGTSVAAATVNSWWDGKQPASTVTLQDPQGLFTRALQAGKGMAVWNEQYDSGNGGYEVIECQSKAGWVDFTLTGSLSGGSSSGATVNDYGGSQQDVQNPGSTVTVYDDQALWPTKTTGAKGRAIYDAVEDKYRIVAMGSETGNPSYGGLQVAGVSNTGGSLNNMQFDDQTEIVGMTRQTSTPNGLIADRDGDYHIVLTVYGLETAPDAGDGVAGTVTVYLYRNSSAMNHTPACSGSLARISGDAIRFTLSITHINYMAATDVLSVKISSTEDVTYAAQLTAFYLGPGDGTEGDPE